MSKHRLRAKLDEEEDKILLPSSSEDESDSALSEDDQVIEDPFLQENEDSDCDSDDAPDALSFREALEDTKSQRRQTTQVIKTQLDQRKKKRKELHDQYMLQKEEKRQKIDLNKLPEDILENLKDDAVLETVISQKNEIGSNDEKEDAKEILSEDVGEHGPTLFKCKVLTEESKKPKYVPEKLVNFKDNLLYGGRIRREKNAREAMLKTEKQRVRLQFIH